MSWLVPAVIATTVATAILSFCYFYLYIYDPKAYLKIWAISWLTYFTRYIFLLFILLWKNSPILLIGNQLSSLISGLLLLYGSYLFIDKKLPRGFYYLGLAGAIWIVASVLLEFNFKLMAFPTFTFLAATYIWTGILFVKCEASYQKENRVVGFAFILWGFHKANYPILRPVIWFAPWGYLIAAILELIVALGLLMIYFKKTKDELDAQKNMLIESKARLLNAQRIAKVGDWSWELKTNDLTWSEETYRIFGQNPEKFEVSVEAFEKAIHPNDFDDFLTKRELSLSNSKEIDIEYRIMIPDGGIRYVHEICSLIKDSQGEAVKVVGTVQDITERKLFEIELENAKAKFEQFFNTNPSATFVWKAKSEDFELVEVNESAQKLTERNAENYIGLKASQIYADLPLLRDRLSECFSEKSTLEFEHNYKVRHSGKFEWVKFRLVFMAPDSLAMYTDVITRQKQSQEALIAAGKRWQNILIKTPQIGITLDTDAKIIFANEQFLKLTGWTREEVIGQDWFALFIPESIRGQVRQVFDDTISQKDAYDYSNSENDILTKSGDLLNIAWSNVLSRNDAYEITDVTCLGLDLTERKNTENEIKRQKRLFETMFNTIPDGVVITNTQRFIQLANKGMEITFGYKPEELIGKETKILYATDDKFKETGKSVFGKDAKKPGDLYITRYKGKNGKEFSGETFGAKLYDEANEWIGNLGIMRDITEREQGELRIQQAQKMESIGNLAGGIAHDFNNILFPIIGLAEMLSEDLPTDSPERINAQEILSAGQRGAELVKQILAFSRQHEPKLIPTRVQQVMDEVVKLTRSTIPMNIRIEHDLQHNCGLVLSNFTQLHQIGMNLITNAYHAVEETEKGQISVNVKEVILDDQATSEMSIHPGRYVMLSVGDNGVGISQANLKKIFDPYFTTKAPGKGTGLGLAVVYGIVKEHKGDIKVQSELGKGTTIEIYLPRMLRQEATTCLVDEIVIEGGTERILVVDDEGPIATLQKNILERLGYCVSTRTNSIEALEAFKAKRDAYDLVITDMSMPHMTGKELAEEILALRPDIPIIICTGFSERLTKDNAMAMGIRGFLMKPVIKAEFAGEVRRVLDESPSVKN